jgi:hypothetical protein
MSKFEFFDSRVENFESFISRNVGCADEKDLKGLVNEEFDNTLFCNNVPRGKNLKGYEIEVKNLHSGYYEFETHEIPKASSLSPRFGCELEVCFILNCRKDDRQEIESILQGDKMPSSGYRWQNLIYYHLRNNIIPYLSKEFTSIFRFAYIKPGYHSESGIMLDLTNGRIVNKDAKGDEYRTLIFEPDSSIQCKSSQSKDIAGNVYDSIPISCEIVTPILSSVQDLKILYEGLLPKVDDYSCIQSNSSMGFHVNVSMVSDKGKIVKLTKGMLSELIYEWLPYEKKHYKNLRGKRNAYAQKLQEYINSEETIRFLTSRVANKNDDEIGVSDIYDPYGLAMWYMVNLINSVKYLSMTHHKNNNVVEFRVFNSNDDIDKLLSYTQDAINIFSSAIKRYCENPIETIVAIQKNNLKYKYLDLETPFKSALVYDYDNIFDTEILERYLTIRGDAKIKVIYSEKSKFLGLGVKRVYYTDLYNLLASDLFYSSKNYIIIYYNTLNKYYRYELNIYDAIIAGKPIEISKQEFQKLDDESYEFLR